MSKSPGTVQISVNVTLEVNRAEWDLTYGTGTGVGVVRDNVREYVLNMLHGLTAGDSGAGDGAIKTVTPRWTPRKGDR